MMDPEVLLVPRAEVETLLHLPACIEAMSAAFSAHALGQALVPALMHLDGDGAEFHIKGGGIRTDQLYVALKANGSNFRNRAERGIPNMMGVILLFDGATGQLLAAMDSIAITLLRTGATTALAARYLARPDSSVVTLCGSGSQSRIQWKALKYILPGLCKVLVWSPHLLHAQKLAAELSVPGEVEAQAVEEVGVGTRQSDIVVTCTPARGYFLHQADVRPGTFVAAVGADSPDKQELEPELLGRSTVVVDILEQCARVGELHHALEAGVMTQAGVHGELGDLVVGRRPGRTTSPEITVFDTTGSAIQDTAAAVAVYQQAQQRQLGRAWNLAC